MFANRVQAQSICTKSRTIQCGITYKDSTDFQTSIVNSYDCVEGSFMGRERAFKFTLAQQRDIYISFQVDETRADWGLFLLNACTLGAGTCVAYSASSAGKAGIVQSLEAGTYYIVVDTKLSEVIGSFRLRLTCTDNVCRRSLSSISCGAYKSKENLAGALNLINEYPGCLNKTYDGLEKVYQFDATNGLSVQVGLHVDTSSKQEFDLFLVQVDETCYEITCLGQATTSAIKGSKYLFAGELNQGTYYLIVDSQTFYSSAEFSIDVSCGDLPCLNLPALNCREPLASSTIISSRDRSKVSMYRVTQANAPARYYPGHSGPERTFSFEVFEAQNITLTLSQVGEPNPKDLSLFVLKSCDKLDAVAASTNRGPGTKSLTVFLNPGTYYAVVDQFLGVDAYKFSLDIQYTQACASICDYGGAFVSRGATFANELSPSEPAPVLLYEDSCVKNAFAGVKKLYADVFLFHNEEAQTPIVLNLTASNASQSIRGFVMRCDSTAKTTCLGLTENGVLNLGPSASGFYYILILDHQNTPYTFTITPKGPCESAPESIPLNVNLTRTVKGKQNDFGIRGSGFDGYSNCYSGARSYQGEDVEFQFTVTADVLASITLSSKTSMGLFLYGYVCGKGCLDYTQTPIGGGSGEIKDFPLSPGTYYLLVDQNDLTDTNGEFNIRINTRPAPAQPFFLAYDLLNSSCVQSRRKGHQVEINNQGFANSLTENDKLYIFPTQLSPQARAEERYWNPSPNEQRVKLGELKMDSLGDAQKCGFRSQDSIYLVMEANDKDQQYIQEMHPVYAAPQATITARGLYTPGGASLIQAFRFIRPRHFALSTRQIIVNPNENIMQSISFKTNVRFTVSIEPAVDYLRIIDHKNTYPAEATELKLSITKNSSGRPRTPVKLIFRSIGTPAYQTEVVLQEKLCIPLVASITASGPTTICPGSSITLSAATNSGSTSDYIYSWSNGSSASFIELKDLQTGSSEYTLSITPKNENQCEVKPLTQNITVLNLPRVPVALRSEVGVCSGQLAPLLSVQPQPGVTHNWYNSANELLPSVDATRFLPRVTQPGNYTYFVEAQSSAGCVSASRVPITLVMYPRFTLNGSVVESQVSCKGGNDGILNLRFNEPIPGSITYLWSDNGIGNRRTGLKAGPYTVTLSMGTNCSQTFSLSLIEPDSLKIGVSSIKADTSSKGTGSIEVKVSGGTPPYTYKWARDGQPISSTPNLLKAKAGSYQLELTDQKQCVLLSPIITIPSVVLSSSIEAPWAARINIYPNPTRDWVNISFDLPESKVVFPEVFNALGESVLRLPAQQVLKESIPADLRGMEAGVYLLRLLFEEGAVVKRVVVGN
jgi:hypothetical protein